DALEDLGRPEALPQACDGEYRHAPRAPSLVNIKVRSAALWLMRRRVVARHTRHARSREDGDGGRAWGRLDAEPALVHAGNGAVPLHAFDGVLDLPEQVFGILAQRRGPHQPGRIKVGELKLRLLLDGVLHGRVTGDVGVGAAGHDRLYRIGLSAEALHRPADLALEAARPTVVARALFDRNLLAFELFGVGDGGLPFFVKELVGGVEVAWGEEIVLGALLGEGEGSRHKVDGAGLQGRQDAGKLR